MGIQESRKLVLIVGLRNMANQNGKGPKRMMVVQLGKRYALPAQCRAHLPLPVTDADEDVDAERRLKGE